jgi:hypothetical protein
MGKLTSTGGELGGRLGPGGALMSTGGELIGGEVDPIGILRSTGGSEGVMGSSLPTTSMQS